MRFNTALLKNIEENDIGLAKVILFSLDQDLNMYHFFSAERSVPTAGELPIVIREELHAEVARVTSALIKSGAIIADYPVGSLSRLSLTQPLYTIAVIEAFDANELRSVWPIGQKSDKYTVTQALKRWFGQNQGVPMNKVVAAGKAYIAWCKQTDRPIRDITNFISDVDGQSFLSQWVDSNVSKQERNDFI